MGTDTGTHSDTSGTADTVELRVPADAAYLSVLRTLVAALAARADFTLDDIDDLRLAVDEVSTLLLADADTSADLTCRVSLPIVADTPHLGIELAVATTDPAEPDFDAFAWQVITALTVVSSVSDTPGSREITLLSRSSVHDQPTPTHTAGGA